MTITEKDSALHTRAFEILKRNSLVPLNLNEWKKSVWHSSHGVCKTVDGKLVFTKIFPPESPAYTS